MNETAVETLEAMREKIRRCIRLAAEFDRRRDCHWNFHGLEAGNRYDPDVYAATDLPQFKALGSMCYGSVLDLALLSTLRPCRKCGGDTLYKSGFQISCCSCFGQEGCPECEDGQATCNAYAENMNLPDAITRWNLLNAKATRRGLVQVIG